MLGAWVAKRVVGIGGTVPGRSSVSGGGRRGVGGDRRYGGRMVGSSTELNCGTTYHLIIIKGQSILSL